MMNINRNKQSLKLIDYITFIVTMFFIAYYFLKLFGFFIDAITFVIPLFVAVGYIFLSMNWTRKVVGYIFGIIALITGVVLVELFCTENSNFIAFISMFVQLLMNVFPLYLVYNILKTKNRKFIAWILATAGIVLAYVLILTFSELQKDDQFMREMGINYTNYQEYNTTNAGGYQFAYAMAVMVGLLISLFLLDYKKYNKLKKSGWLLALIATFLLVLNSSYTLALMICIISIFIAITLKMKKTTTRFIFWALGIIAFFLILYMSDWIIALMPTGEMKLRFSEVFTFLKSGDASGYNLNGRLTLYWKSIKSFFKSPFIGNVTLDFDPHSSILRFFARDGILGGMGYILLYYFGYHIITKYFITERQKKLFVPVFISIILMGLVNPIHSVGAVHYVAFFIAPLALNLIDNNEEKVNETSLGN